MKARDIERMFDSLERVRKAAMKAKDVPDNLIQQWAKTVIYYEKKEDVKRLSKLFSLMAWYLAKGDANGDV